MKPPSLWQSSEFKETLSFIIQRLKSNPWFKLKIDDINYQDLSITVTEIIRLGFLIRGKSFSVEIPHGTIIMDTMVHQMGIIEESEHEATLINEFNPT